MARHAFEMRVGPGLLSQVGMYGGEVGPVADCIVEGAQQVAVGFVAGSGDTGEALLQGSAFEVGIGAEYAQGGAACRLLGAFVLNVEDRTHFVAIGGAESSG